MSASQTSENWHQGPYFDLRQIKDDTACLFSGHKIMPSLNMVCRVHMWLPYLTEPLVFINDKG